MLCTIVYDKSIFKCPTNSRIHTILNSKYYKSVALNTESFYVLYLMIFCIYKSYINLILHQCEVPSYIWFLYHNIAAYLHLRYLLLDLGIQNRLL